MTDAEFRLALLEAIRAIPTAEQAAIRVIQAWETKVQQTLEGWRQWATEWDRDAKARIEEHFKTVETQVTEAMQIVLENHRGMMREQLATYKASAETNDANWLKSHAAAEEAAKLTEQHHLDCKAAHQRYFNGLEALAQRIKMLEEKAEPWQP